MYPGQRLVEGTQLSEGRGTTRPFDLTGMPGINSDRFAWPQPPYEYEPEKMPIDILSGSSDLRQQIESGTVSLILLIASPAYG